MYAGSQVPHAAGVDPKSLFLDIEGPRLLFVDGVFEPAHSVPGRVRVERVAVAGVALARRQRGVGDADAQHAPFGRDAHVDLAAFRQARDAVPDGVLQQRLQHQPRQAQCARQRFHRHGGK